MNDKVQKCFFTYACRILKVKKCDGSDTSCSLFKTEEKFNSDRNAAIGRCCEKDLCHDCKYNKKPCVKSDEF